MNSKIQSIRAAFSRYLNRSLGATGLIHAWRLRCFDQGSEYAALMNQDFLPLAGKAFLDMAAGWGGHSVAFGAYGCRITACDLSDFSYDELTRFATAQGLDFTTRLADCQDSPFPNNSFDIILALQLIEHITHPDLLAHEVARLLKPGGACIVSTPARLRAIYEREPHFHLRGLALLPFRWQGPVARRIFRASYPFPITRQYTFSSSVARPFERRGLVKHVRLSGRSLRWAQRSPILKWIMEAVDWKLIILQKPDVIARDAVNTIPPNTDQ